MASASLDVDDVVILLLGAPSEAPSLKDRIEGITRLEKMFFLLEHEEDLGVPVDAKFVAHNFGPFSAQIYQAVDVLSAAQLIEDSAQLANNADDAWESGNLIYGRDEIPDLDRYTTRNFQLTPRGRRYYEALISELPPGTEQKLAGFKSRFGRMPLRQLVRYVYEQPDYEKYLENSLIRKDILGR